MPDKPLWASQIFTLHLEPSFIMVGADLRNPAMKRSKPSLWTGELRGILPSNFLNEIHRITEVINCEFRGLLAALPAPGATVFQVARVYCHDLAEDSGTMTLKILDPGPELEAYTKKLSDEYEDPI